MVVIDKILSIIGGSSDDYVFKDNSGTQSSHTHSKAQITDLPAIPEAANNGTLTIKKNGTDVAQFGADSASDVTANISVPTELSELSTDTTHRVVTDIEKSNWNNKAPTNHATPDTTYGVGDSANYGHVRVDSALSTSSTNPVQNRAVKAAIDQSIANEATARADADTALGERIDTEESDRQQADSELQAQIDAISSKSDVVDVVGSYAELLAYDTSMLGDNDVVKVIEDETQDDAESYYRWNLTTQTWGYIGSQGPFVTPAEMQRALNDKVDKVTGKGLSTNDFTDAAKSITDNIFLATYNSTSYADIKAAYDAGKVILCRFNDSTPSRTLRVATFDSLLNNTQGISYAYFSTVTKLDAYELVASKSRYGSTTTWSNTSKSWGTLAEKSSVTDGDISGTISDSHIASASTWNGKQDAISNLSTIISNASNGQTAYGWGDHSTWKPTFSQASTRTNLTGSNETISTIFGKIKKWFADLKTVAFTGSYNDLTNKPTIPPAITVDSAMSSTSTNPVQNKIVKSALDDKLDKTGDGKDLSVTFDEDYQILNNVVSGESLSFLFKKVHAYFSMLRSIAFQDFVTDLDISGTISDSHIASASTWNGKQDRIRDLTTIRSNAENGQTAYGWGDHATWTPTFSQASSRTNLEGSGETIATILGKVMKWFADLGSNSLAWISKNTSGSDSMVLSQKGNWVNLPSSGMSTDANNADASAIHNLINKISSPSTVIGSDEYFVTAKSSNQWKYTMGTLKSYALDGPANSVKDSGNTSKNINIRWENSSVGSAFNHFACFRTKDGGDANTSATICDMPITEARKQMLGSSKGGSNTPLYLDSNGELKTCSMSNYVRTNIENTITTSGGIGLTCQDDTDAKVKAMETGVSKRYIQLDVESAGEGGNVSVYGRNGQSNNGSYMLSIDSSTVNSGGRGVCGLGHSTDTVVRLGTRKLDFSGTFDNVTNTIYFI